MFPLASAHVPADILEGAQGMAGASIAQYQRGTRARIAAALRRQLREGRVPPTDVQSIFAQGIAGTDTAIKRLGQTLVRQSIAAVGTLPTLGKAALRLPGNPQYDNPAVRAGIRHWGERLLRAGAITPNGLARALKRGGATPTVALRGAAAAYADRELARWFERFGGPPRRKLYDKPFWQVMPATLCWQGPDGECPSVVLVPEEACTGRSYTETCLDFDMDHPDASAICGLISRWPCHALSVLAPHEFVAEGYLGSGLFWDDLMSYRKEVVATDGTITLTDELLEHMEMEHGHDRNDPDSIELLTRAMAFLVRRPERIPTCATRAVATKALRRRLKHQPNGESRVALDALWRLGDALAERIGAGRKTFDASALSEESYGAGLHIVKANLCGLEDQVLDDHERMTWEVGCDGTVGATAVGDTDAWEVFELCVAEACGITVMSSLLSRYNEAQRG
ncbi:MAG: hypothetical protein BGO50_10740 [Rhodanobacter sp. 67-28]|nr:MAG: hypothetical protein ABS98_04995 [Xanthomonadaceae bacterium SCN 69-48]OJW34726.1 MAG: hypothetical protein BGO50_10740 [Rhodanobacter sp. 67-28]